MNDGCSLSLTLSLNLFGRLRKVFVWSEELDDSEDYWKCLQYAQSCNASADTPLARGSLTISNIQHKTWVYYKPFFSTPGGEFSYINNTKNVRSDY